MRREIHKKITLVTLGLAAVSMPYSVKLCHLGLILFIINWIAEGEWTEKIKALQENPLVWLFPAFVLLHLIGITYTENISNGWANLEKKAFLFALPIVLASSPALSKSELRTLFRFFVLSCFVATVVCMVNAFSLSLTAAPFYNFGSETLESYQLLNPGVSNWWMYFSYIGLASAINIHPTYLGLYLLLCLLLIIKFLRESREEMSATRRYLMYALFSYFTLFIIFLSSRIITISALIVVLVAASQFITQKTKSFTVAGAVLVILGIFSFVYINPVSRYRSLQELLITRIAVPVPSTADNSVNIRASLWWLGDKALRQINPWIGAGTGDVDDVLLSLGDQYGVHNILNTYDPHNQFMHTLIGLGLVGLALLMACLLAPMFVAYRRKFFLYTAFTSVFMLICLTESALEVQKGIIFFSFFSSLLFFHQKGLAVPSEELSYA